MGRNVRSVRARSLYSAGVRMRFKKTEVCQTCSKIKNVCQTCLLDLEYGELAIYQITLGKGYRYIKVLGWLKYHCNNHTKLRKTSRLQKNVLHKLIIIHAV